ncbi:hypothetical protein [Phaeospirillum tilakii]|uniref:DUF1376 domain-containing protein n=1 Tax=Phaeospirillum tilakii TaxID=741673 RepID=A0ABW5CFB5_9PROT
MNIPDIPPPLVPADCDLRDFAFIPLDVARLRDSDFACRATDAAFRAGVMLWLASWHQVPAGSLPDDDCVLSMLAGYGRVVRVWQRHRAGALHGWVKCSDGRLYHPVICEKAREAWRSKQERHHQRLCDRLRKENSRRVAKGLPEVETPSFDAWVSAGSPAEWTEVSPTVPLEKADVPAEHHGLSAGTGEGAAEVPEERARASAGTHFPSAGNPPENALKGQGQGEDKEGRGGGGAGALPIESPEARQVVDRFKRLRRDLWPLESGFPAPDLTLLTEAEGFLGQAPVALVLDVVERGMRQSATDERPAPGSLRAYRRSITNAAVTHRNATAPSRAAPAAVASAHHPKSAAAAFYRLQAELAGRQP